MVKSQEKALANNLVGINFLRFVAAFSVFYYHQHLGHLLSKYTQLNLLKYTDIFGERYAVPLFFIISGFCIHYSAQKSIPLVGKFDLKKFYLSRFWRIYPPYLIALMISITLNSFLPYSVNSTSLGFLIYIVINTALFVRHTKLMTIPIALGVSSYSIYLLHQPLINFKNHLIAYHTSDKTLSMILMDLSIILIPVVCYFGYRLFELPFIKYRKSATQKS